MTAPRPSEQLLDQYRRHRSNLHSWQTLYPYAMGRVESALTAPGLSAQGRVKEALLQIAALDIVSAEPLPEPESEPA
ncbi:hypothetical protein [Sphingomonas sp.]|uniref:hypothetical protein n=1 Tax=Sphingomonas sp. TaxID=28214 RepID=UPI003BA8B380